MTRIVTGVLLGAAVVCLILWGPVDLMVAVQLAFTLAGLWEFLRLSRGCGVKGYPLLGYCLALAAGAAPLMTPAVVGPLGILGLAAVLWLAVTLPAPMARHRLLGSSLMATLLGVCYVAIPLALLVWVWRRQDGPFHLLFLMAVIWAGDTAGYFIGKFFGRHKSSPRISPNKTWEGTIASFVAALIVGFVTANYFWGQGPVIELVVLAAALNIAGQVGDLAESALKRSAGVKDSSNLIPGHGGVLDRLDALLFAAPVLWYYWLWRVG